MRTMGALITGRWLPESMTVTIGTETGVYTLTKDSKPGLCASPCRVISYSQRDPRWKDYRYDNGYTLGGSGCLITSIAMIASRAYGDRLTPLMLARVLKAKHFFINGHLVHHGRWGDIRDRLGYEGMVNWHDGDADLEVLRTELEDYGLTIIQLLARGGQMKLPTEASHFVVLQSLTEDDAWIIDPWDAKRKLLSFTPYVKAGWSTERAVYGLRRYRVRL